MKKKKILILDNYKFTKSLLLSKLKKYKLVFKKFKNKKNLKNFLNKNRFYGIYSTFGQKLDISNLENNRENLKYIISPTTGTDHIDLKYCKKNEINVITLKNNFFFLKNITATAELTWGLILSLSRNINLYSRDVLYKNLWNRNAYLSQDLKSNSIGIIGYGRLGQIVARYARAFQMKIFVYDTNPKKKFPNYIKKSNLDKILSCKFITIHIPLDNNKNLFSKKILNKIKPNSYLINTSRGDLFEEKSLIQFIKKKKYFGLGFDVLPQDVVWGKKIAKDYFFLKKIKKNLIITPHIGGNTIETRIKTTNYILDLFLKKEKKISFINTNN